MASGVNMENEQGLPNKREAATPGDGPDGPYVQAQSAWEIFLIFLRLGLTSFGGPVAHLAYFRDSLIEKRRWLSEAHYAQMLAICHFLPGPASSQVGFALGLFRGGWLGGLAAFTGFTLPSVLILVAFAMCLPSLPEQVATQLVHGLKLVACVVVVDAVWGMYQKLCTDNLTKLIAVMSACFILLSDTLASQLWVILVAGLLGYVFCRPKSGQSDVVLPVFYSRRVGMYALGCFVALLAALAMSSNVFEWAAIAEGFYHAGALVFGGGHVVLPWLEEFLVGGSLIPAESFLAGYGAAQAVPGPLFTFSAFLGFELGMGWTRLFMVLLCVAAIFLPGFLLLIAFLPFWHKLSSYASARFVLAGVNAGVVGILAAVLYDPVFTVAVETRADFAIVLIGMMLLKVFKFPVLSVVAAVVLSAFLIL